MNSAVLERLVVIVLVNKQDCYVINMTSTDDLVSAGNARDLLFLRQTRTTRFSTIELKNV